MVCLSVLSVMEAKLESDVDWTICFLYSLDKLLLEMSVRFEIRARETFPRPFFSNSRSKITQQA